MAFVKGQSGNPSGKAKAVLPDGRTLSELARELTIEALDVAAVIMRDPAAPHAARASVVSMILDRGWGRPAQSLTLSGDAENPLHTRVALESLSEAELRVLAKIRLEDDATVAA
ncbi:hypothetical protein [Glacieibacterium sp.]|uniref:hypothetical protein n=1 Tax=Glacieibacterium sp. TaxID=2860237 RepID=UPI003AFF9129